MKILTKKTVIVGVTLGILSCLVLVATYWYHLQEEKIVGEHRLTYLLREAQIEGDVVMAAEMASAIKELRNSGSRRLARKYRMAVEQGADDADMQYRFGHYYHWLVMPTNHSEAARWYRLAAEQGHVRAQYMLGVLNDRSSASRGSAESAQWYRLAAERGHAPAQAALARLYYEGDVIPSNYAESFRWYQMAARNGYTEAQYRLGLAYYRGEGIEQNYHNAYVYFSLAVAGGGDYDADNSRPLPPQQVRSRRYRSISEGTLSQSELAAAQQEAARLHREIERRKAAGLNYSETHVLPITQSADNDIRPTPSQGDTLLLSGDIVQGDATRLEVRIVADEVRKITFNSGGGDIAEAVAIGRLIRENLIATEVPYGSECHSACVFAFAGGVVRMAPGTIGIHSFYSDDFIGSGDFADASEVYNEVSVILEVYLEEMRIPDDLLDHIKRVPHDEISILGPEEREAYFLEGIDPVYRQTHMSQ